MPDGFSLPPALIDTESYAPADLSISGSIQATNKYTGARDFIDYPSLLSHIQKAKSFEQPVMLQFIKDVDTAMDKHLPDINMYIRLLSADRVIYLIEYDLNGNRREDTSCGLDYPTRMYILKHHSDDVRKLVDSLHQGEFDYTLDTYIKSFNKDEFREVGKDPRGISVPQFIVWIVGMVLHGGFYEYLKKYLYHHSSAFGIDDSPVSWTRLFRKFSLDNTTFCQDIGKQDSRYNCAVADYLERRSANVLTKHVRLLQWWFDQMFHNKRWVDAYGNVFNMPHGNCSGHSNTITFNGDMTLLCHSLAEALHKADHGEWPGLVIVCTGDDTVFQVAPKYRDTYISCLNYIVCDTFNHELKGNVYPSLHGADFLSRTLHIRGNLIYPVYSNIAKAIASLSYYTGDIEDYVAKLESFKRLLMYAEPLTNEHVLLEWCDNASRDLHAKYKDCRCPYIPIPTLLLQNSSYTSSYCSNSVGGLKFDMSSTNNVKTNVKKERALNERIRKQRAELRKQQSTIESKKKNGSKSRGQGSKSKPSRNQAAARGARNYDAPASKAMMVNKDKRVQAILHTMIDPSKSVRLPSDDPSSLTTLWKCPASGYDIQYQSNPESPGFAIMDNPDGLFFLDKWQYSDTVSSLSQSVPKNGSYTSSFTGVKWCLDVPMSSTTGTIIPTSALKGTAGFLGMSTSTLSDTVPGPYYRGEFTCTGGSAITLSYTSSNPYASSVINGYFTVNEDGTMKKLVTFPNISVGGQASGSTQINAGTLTTFVNDIADSYGFNFYIQFQSNESQNNRYHWSLSVDFAGTLTRAAGYSWKHVPFGYTLAADGNVSTSPFSHALGAYLSAYSSYRPLARSTSLHTQNFGAGQNGFCHVARRIPSGANSVRELLDPVALFREVSMIPGQNEASDRQYSDTYYFMRDRPEQWDFSPTTDGILIDNDVKRAFIQNSRWPCYIAVFLNPKSIVNPEITIPTVLMGTINQSWEFMGSSPLGPLAYPPSGQAQYRELYAVIVRQYATTIPTNSGHMRTMRAVIKQVAMSPATRVLAETLWGLIKVGVPMAATMLVA